jgi:hypothetical protein
MSVNDGFDTPRRRSLRDCGLDAFTPRGCKTRAGLDAGDPGLPARVFPLRKWNRIGETGLATVSAFPSAAGDQGRRTGQKTEDRGRRTGEHGPYLRSPVPRLRSKSKPMHVRRSDLPRALVWVPAGTCVEQGLREEVLL